MANPPIDTPPSESPPDSYPQVTPPRDLYAISDIRFVLVELGKITTKIDALTEKASKQDDRLKDIETAIDRVKTGFIVATTILTCVGGIFWWALGDRITTAVRNGLLTGPPISGPAKP